MCKEKCQIQQFFLYRHLVILVVTNTYIVLYRFGKYDNPIFVILIKFIHIDF